MAEREGSMWLRASAWRRALVASLIALPLLARARGASGQADPHAGHGEHAGHGDHQTSAAEDAAPAPPTLLALERLRNASGTAWQPETTPHHAIHVDAAGWRLMLHGVLFGGYDVQGGPRGASAAMAVGWLMGMADRDWSSGRAGLRVMLSPEPFTVRDGGYPLLLQTGETWKGAPLFDKQHPHDLFMEIALHFTQAITDGLAVQIYAAPAGEPALGPVAFPHRFSSAHDPLATIGHHWQDSTHISFGVLSAAIITRYVKLDASWFNGKEPDEDRNDFDLERPNAVSARLSANPLPTVSAQVSWAHLPAHGAGHADPGADHHHDHGEVDRITASVAHTRQLDHGGHWATLASFGRNQGHDFSANAYLLESAFGWDAKNTVFARAELVEKTGVELVLPESHHDRSYDVGLLAAGFVRSFGPFGGVLPGIGVRGAVHLVPGSLAEFYGRRTPIAGMIYLRALLVGGGHAHH